MQVSPVYLQICLDHPYIHLLTFTFANPDATEPSSFLYRRVEVLLDEKSKHKGIVWQAFSDPLKLEKKLSPDSLKEIVRFLDKQAILTSRQVALAEALSPYYRCSLGQMLFAMLPAAWKHTPNMRQDSCDENSSVQMPPLTTEQDAAYKKILATPAHNIHTHLIYGVTGSGKTRLYIEIIKKYLQHNYSVLLLIPEIAISYQLYNSLKPIFKQDLAYWHSSLSPQERLCEYKKIQAGEARLVLGTRSAVFAPLQNLRLIIFDEEHDASFKQNRQPRYNAKRVAYIRLQQELEHSSQQGLAHQIILGSATPSLESYYLASKKIFSLHKLEKRATGFSQPKLFLSQLDVYHDQQIFTPFTVQKMRWHLQKGNQIFIILNRRGHSRYAFCPDCQTREGCPHCSVSLTYHQDKKNPRAQGVLKCHICGFEKDYSACCSSCGKKLKLVGKGVQRVENVLEKNFSSVSFARLDRDSASERGYSEEILSAMREQKIQILLGTQMIAKGFDMPKVTLVVIANADDGLYLPDFRATERVFQLLVQSSGRSGRHQEGEVIVQSAQPQHYVLQSVLNSTHDDFYRHEIYLRQEFGYPPFKKLLRFLLLSKDENLLQSLKQKLSQWLLHSQQQTPLFENEIQEQLPQQILPPQDAPLYRLNQDYRAHLLAKDNCSENLLRFAARLDEFGKRYVAGTSARYEIDIDPLDIL